MENIWGGGVRINIKQTNTFLFIVMGECHSE